MVSEGRFERFGEPVGGAGDDGCGPSDAERDVLNDLNVGGAHVSHGDVDAGNECGREDDDHGRDPDDEVAAPVAASDLRLLSLHL